MGIPSDCADVVVVFYALGGLTPFGNPFRLSNEKTSHVEK